MYETRQDNEDVLLDEREGLRDLIFLRTIIVEGNHGE
jgi:hypothetical protein